MKKAKFIEKKEDYAGNARLYECTPPMEWDYWDGKKDVKKKAKYVIVSAANVMYDGPETYIFPANKKGEVTNWGELEGSYKGGLSHRAALQGAGYDLEE